jgi:multidrug transporter EmrE-like cation transporter
MSVFQSLVYLLCMATSLVCLLLLVRAYQRSGVKFLLWSALCFVGLALNNFLLFIDVVLLPTSIDLLPLRHITALGAVGVLLYGFIWESE